ncbi:amidase [Marinomonas phage P12026]|uniref:amidase n=1 Tax=Marinomonas phage P12026 TaxID=1176423 RepID=UPI0002688F41|nr:amidase [Marinomonas phage P12026]AFM54869.1 putative N-acetylmuramoyl-L-alanine amidase [Marinomonas phage P12026]
MKKIVIHCSDTPNGRDDTAEDIHGWHLAKGWDGIGYHHVIEVGGAVRAGRPHYWIGSHVAGYNEDSLGICMIGRDQFDGDQWRALEGLVLSLNAQYPDAEVLGHRDLDSKKTCPNFDVRSWWSDVKKRSMD